MQDNPALNTATIANSVYSLLRAGNSDKAISLCKNALNGAPNDPFLLDAMGMIYANNIDLENAETCFRASLKFSPKYPNALNNLGNVLRETENFNDAVDLYQDLIKILPKQVTAHTNLGKAFLGAGNNSSAILSLERALSLDPLYTSARLALANATTNIGKLNEAITLLEDGIKLTSGDVSLYKYCAELYIQTGDAKRAIGLLEQARLLAPEDHEILFTLGNQLADQLKFKQAEQILQKALTLTSKKSEICNSLGILFKNQEKPDIAAVHYRKAIDFDDNNAKAHNNLGNALADLENSEEALYHFNRAIALEPDFDEAYINRAQVLDLSPDHPELKRLIGYLSSATLTTENKTNLLFTLGKIHDELGLYQKAFEYTHKGNAILAKIEKYDRKLHRQAIASVITSFNKPVYSNGTKFSNKPIPIFILGMTRSGKTITEKILANHPEVYAGGERSDWQKIVKSARKEQNLDLPFPQFLDHLSEDHIGSIGEHYLSNIEEEADGARYFIDTMPSNFPYIGLMLKAFPEVKIITCQRHLLDNCLYAYFQRYKHANGYSYDLKDAASFFADYHKMLGHWHTLFGDRILSQTYEDLVANPAEKTRQLFEFCDLKFSEDWIPGYLNDSEVGRWQNYTEELLPLVQWLQKEAKQPS